jgi:hypothetical protein
VALLLSGVYRGRALPVAWLVRQGTQGHCPEDLHLAVVKQGKGRIPEGAPVSWDGETFRLDTVGWCIQAGPLVE